MLLSLVKKDFILVKKYVLFMAVVCFLLPVFLLSRLPEEGVKFSVSMGKILL